jgi:membrane protease subunit HflC
MVVAILVIIAVILSLATYTVGPGRTAMVLHDGKARVVASEPGLHWKLPLIQSVTEVDQRTRTSTGEVQSGAKNDEVAARYSVFWRVTDPARYYDKTHDVTTAVEKKFNQALTPVLRKTMGEGDARQFLAGSHSGLHEAMTQALEPLAEKLGIAVSSVNGATSRIPTTLATNVASTMAASIQTQISALKSTGKLQRKQIAETAAKKSTDILADAKSRAATITGKSQASVAATYAPSAKKAPEFFDYYIGLESEVDSLQSNTRVLVLSMDSPWFKTLERSAKQAKHDK